MAPATHLGRRARLRRAAVLLAVGLLWATTAGLPTTGAAFTATTAATAQFTAWVPVVAPVLTQPAAPAGTASCVSDSTGTGPCAAGVALTRGNGVAVTNDGSSAYVASAISHAVSAFSRSTSTGFLTQLAGADACVQNNAVVGGTCSKATLMFASADVAVSADRKHVYTVSPDNNAITVLTRAGGGALTRVSGTAGCVQVTSSSSCTGGAALSYPRTVSVSPDDKHVYVVSGEGSRRVAILSRNATSGELTHVGCLTSVSPDTGAPLCTFTNMLSGVNNIAFSPDSAFAYASAGGTSAVLAFGRSSVTGALTPLAGTASCVSETGNAGTCADGVALIGATDVAVSPDGSSVYVTASSPSNAVAVFSRNVGTGVLSQLAGTAGCVSDDGTSAACVDGIALQGASAVAVNSDGTNVFIVGRFSDSLSVFHRDASTGALTQATGTAGCLSPTASGCTVIRALTSPNALAVSGEDVYVTSNSGVALFTGR